MIRVFVFTMYLKLGISMIRSIKTISYYMKYILRLTLDSWHPHVSAQLPDTIHLFASIHTVGNFCSETWSIAPSVVAGMAKNHGGMRDGSRPSVSGLGVSPGA